MAPAAALRAVVWCRPAAWEDCISSDGVLNSKALVEKKAAEANLQELISEKGWVPYSPSIPAALGMPLVVWAAAPSTDGAEEEPLNGAVTRLMESPDGAAEGRQPAVHGLAVVARAGVSADVTPEMLRNLLLFISDMREVMWPTLPSAEDVERTAKLQALMASAKQSWPTYVRQLTMHLRARMLLEASAPPMPVLLPDGTLDSVQ